MAICGLSLFVLGLLLLLVHRPRALKIPFVERPHDSYPSSYTLEFRLDGTFKILQLADIHLGEATHTDWGPQQDAKTFRLLDRVVPMERPDLIVLSGDQLTANDLDSNASAYYRILGERLSYYGVPWAMIFGNHDDMPREYKGADGTTVYTNVTKTSRQDLLAVEREFPLSLSRSVPDLFGTSNYFLEIHNPSHWTTTPTSQDTTTAVQLFFLDSGGGTLEEQLEENQIEWFQKNHRRDIPGVFVFQHIPSNDFVYMARACQGLHENELNTIGHDPGIVRVLQKAGNVHVLAVGHLHGSDYCCNTNNYDDWNSTKNIQGTDSNLHLCFGRHSGYGGYGTWDRGARVYELKLTRDESFSVAAENHDGLPSFDWNSWVRMESGEVVDKHK